jgi:hypothetical protein
LIRLRSNGAMPGIKSAASGISVLELLLQGRKVPLQDHAFANQRAAMIRPVKF